MKYFNIKRLTPFICGVTSVLLLGSCSKDGEVRKFSSSDLVLSGSYKSASSRNHWQEDNSVSSGLKFFWDNSKEGEENLSITIGNSSKFYDFEDYKNYNMAKVETTSNPLVSQITLTEQIDSESCSIEEGDEIYSVVPVVKDESIIASHNRLLATLFIPNEISSTVLNSTEHLSPYMYMLGEGTINAEKDFLTSKIYYQMLPAILRFKIINSSTAQTFTPKAIYIMGDICTLATINIQKLSSPVRTEKNTIYSIGDKIGIKLNGVNIDAGKSGNTYAVAFPTDFTGKKLLFKLIGEYNGTQVERIAYLSGDIIPESQLKSNYCYTFNLEINENDFKIGTVSCGSWNGDEEDLPSTPKQ
ncbi:hypothetical protein WKU26_11560 [Phocaeicola sp. HCN-40430]|uniref:hypothetical protein n=1 Tax=Phocaeicola sp. HCN-40430 TaxID=3134664 RepID=UPI0030BBF2CA